MPRLLARGADSRKAIVQALLEHNTLTEDEAMAETGLGRSTVRKTLALLADHDMIRSKRRKQEPGRRGPGAIEYWLVTRLQGAGSIEKALHGPPAKRQPHPAPATPAPATLSPAPVETPLAQTRGLFIIVKKGTNDAILTKDGRILRVETPALEGQLKHHRSLLKGSELESVPLEDFYSRFYPETRKGLARPFV